MIAEKGDANEDARTTANANQKVLRGNKAAAESNGAGPRACDPVVPATPQQGRPPRMAQGDQAALRVRPGHTARPLRTRRLFNAYSRWVEASLQIQQFGLILNSPSGYPMQSPCLAILNTALEQFQHC